MAGSRDIIFDMRLHGLVFRLDDPREFGLLASCRDRAGQIRQSTETDQAIDVGALADLRRAGAAKKT